MEKYISKDALIAEIERLISNGQVKLQESQESNDYESYVAWAEHIATCIKVLSFIDTLEVKEVDLEEEITSQIRLLNGVHTLDNGKQWWKGTYNELYYFAKYFFELGLKAKGEYQSEQKPIEINYEELIEKRKQTLMAWSELNDAAFREANLLGYDQAIKDILYLINKKED